jgi:hypothetical protein
MPRSRARTEYVGVVEKTARIFRNFEEAELADREYYASHHGRRIRGSLERERDRTD